MNARSSKIADGPRAVTAKLERMRDALRGIGRLAVAFSGGVDSTFVLKVAADTLGRENVLAVTGRSASVSGEQMRDAAELARLIGTEHVVLDTQEFGDPNYLANPADRCYYCKTELYSRMAPLVRARGFTVIANGTNADDLGDHRPGLFAAAEHDVRSPCADAGLTKAEIRLISKELGLPTFDKPASPCLSSRIPYGIPVTPKKLRMIEKAEAFLHELGIRECRVRHHDALARIEVPREWIEQVTAEPLRGRIEAALREIGYRYVTVDLRGFRSGSLNEVIAFGRRQQETMATSES